MAPVGVRSGYYPGGEDALVMWVRDIDCDGYRTRLGDVRAASPGRARGAQPVVSTDGAAVVDGAAG